MLTADYEAVGHHGRVVDMRRQLYRYSPIFILLALTGLIFLLSNIHTLEVRVTVSHSVCVCVCVCACACARVCV